MDRVAEARGLTVTTLADDGITATYRVAFDLVLDQEARAEAGRMAPIKHRAITTEIRRTVKRGLRLFFSDE